MNLSRICRFALSYFFLFIGSLSVHSQAYCVFSPKVKSIYHQIISLELSKAKTQLDASSDSSANKAYLLLRSSLNFYRFFILEELIDSKTLNLQRDQFIESVKKSELPIQWQRFLESELLLHSAMMSFKSGEQFSGFKDFYSASSLLEKNIQEFPDFIYSYKSSGILHALLAGIPDTYKWAARLIGLKGQIVQGKQELEKFIKYAEQTQDLFLEESYAAFAFITAYLENKPEMAYTYWVKKMGYADPNPLYAYVQSRLAIRCGYTDAAINILQSLPIYERDQFPYLHYLLGLCKLNKLDFSAEASFYQYLQIYKGQSHLKESYQKLAWCSRMRGNIGMYRLHMTKCLSRGTVQLDEDKQAYFEAKSGVIPDSILLRARLLTDGNFPDKALEVLVPYKNTYYQNDQLKLEYAYRLGRIFQLLQNYKEAIHQFEDALQFDPGYKFYMSCNALLQIGIIYETQSKKQEAIQYYQKVLETQPDQYQRSIHQKAKAGLSRLN
ncbi:MAG: tetratricopeptide repeat protein [Saprospiraceae bacterium]|nr:tetratricopeptide repeat protein [Saprospiraceae bacterium]MBK7738469.1 tetratricopeptide repeat protein [Saprospiraceae bacterium]MBK7912959.1 tetratricopeptide repeat protein [Saprospiraceae bacterium]